MYHRLYVKPHRASPVVHWVVLRLTGYVGGQHAHHRLYIGHRRASEPDDNRFIPEKGVEVRRQRALLV